MRLLAPKKSFVNRMDHRHLRGRIPHGGITNDAFLLGPACENINPLPPGLIFSSELGVYDPCTCGSSTILSEQNPSRRV